MIVDQPAAPAAPAAPSATAAGSADLAQQLDNVNQAVEQASRLAAARAAQAGAAAEHGGAMGIMTGAGGQIVVTGPDGKTISIDPHAGLDGDQIQAMVQTALQPTHHESEGRDGKAAIPIVAIIFTFLFLIVLTISRTVRARAALSGPVTASLPPETVARLARIEQAVEAVAIEVERISEAQRYSAQLLTNRLSEGVPASPSAIGRTIDAPVGRG